VRKLLAYVGLAAAVALVTSAAMLSYTVTRDGQSMSGVIVRYEEAALDVADQPGAFSELKIDRVVAPGPSWIVVSQVTMGATRGMMEEPDPNAAPAPEPRILAVAAVGPGEARDLVVKLDTRVRTTRMLSVVLHADRGNTGAFEWDMNRFAESPDKPYFRLAEGANYSPVQLGMNVLVQ
jgi:hypothetical protein